MGEATLAEGARTVTGVDGLANVALLAVFVVVNLSLQKLRFADESQEGYRAP